MPQLLDVFSVAMIALLAILTLLIPVIAYYLTKAISPEIEYFMKRERFESGNPRSGRSRGYFIMQYYPYLLMFTSLEPLVVLMIFVLTSRGYITSVLYILGAGLLVILPVIYLAYRYAGETDLWREE